MEMDLWSINPETGDFDNVGVGVVSDDGSVVETIEGGIRNSSWHFFAPPPISPPNNNNPPPDCDECQETGKFKSEVELHSGAVIEDYELVNYSSNGESRGISLTYDSLRADPRPIFQFSYSNVNPGRIAPQFTNNLRLIADLTIDGNGLNYQLPGYQGGESPLIDESKHFWSLPQQPGEIKMALQADLRDWESGKYDFVLNNGIKLYIPELDNPFTDQTFPPQLLGSSRDYEDKILHVNTIDSAFGSGWGIDGWQEIIENSDGSILLIDGDGSELWFDASENEGKSYVNPPGDFSVLEKLPDGSFRRTMKDGMVYQFNLQNQLQSVIDSNGNSTQYIYDDQQQLTTIVDPVGLETKFTYNLAGKVDTITDPANKVTRLEYDSQGNLITITNPDTSTSNWSYDAEHHMIGETDANGNQATANYNQFGRATSATTEDGSTIEVNPSQTQGLYSPEATTSFFSAPTAYLETSGLSAFYADENGRTTQTQLDTSGQKVAAIDNEGATGRNQRNSDNLISNQIDARGFQTNYTYDERGNVVSISQEIDSLDDESEPQPLFPYSIQETDNPHEAIVSGDFNNDGIIDLANPNRILLGVGDGTFIEESNDSISGDIIQTEDLDNDGFLDLIIASGSSIRLRFNNGDGTFEDGSSSIYRAQEFVEAVAIEDFNNDGLLDVIAAGFNGNVSLFANQSNRIFASSSNFGLGERLDDMVAGDFNADGNLDLVGALNQSKTINVLYGNGDGTLESAIDFYTGSRKINSLAAGDLNNDGIEDLIATVQNSLNITVFIGGLNAPFEVPVDYPGTNKSASNFTALDLGDFNNDGNLDVVSFNSLLENVSILLGLGDGTLATPQPLNILPGASTDLALGDFDSDGWLDIAASNTVVRGITLFSNQGDGDFRDNYQTFVTTNTTNFATGDINNDGFPDLVSVNYDQRTVSAYVGGRDGTFEFLEEYSLRNRPSAVNLADFNGDGLLDLVTGSFNEVSILLGNGDGSFDNEPQYYVPGEGISSSSRPQAIHTEDLNRDGVADLLLDYGNTKDFFSVLLSNGDGSFADAVVYDTERYLNLDVEDLDGDGSLDVIIGDWITNNFSVRYGNGDGSFADPVSYSLGTNTKDLDIGDVNRDGFMDLVIADQTSSPNWFEHEIYVLLNNGNRTFAQAIELDSGNTFGNADSIALIDLDRDQNLDLVTLYHNGISTALGNGQGIFTPDQRYTAGNEPQSFTIADLDLDESPDLLILNSKNASWYDSYISVLLNQTAGENSLNFTTTEYTYDPVFNKLTSATDELGRQTLYDIDPDNGNLLSSTQVVGEVGGDDDVTISYTYTDAGLVDTMTDPLGRVTDYDYDERGNLIKETYAVGTPDEASINYEYDLAGNQTAVIDENGNRTEFEYDAKNRLIKTTYAVGTPDEAVSTTEYDLNGNQIATVDGNGNRTEFKYDEKDRLIKTISPDPDGDGELTSPVTTSTYDGVGNLIATTDPLGRETRYVYDSRNRLIETILPDGTTEKSKYDTDNNLIASSDAAGESTNKIYDARGRLVRETDPQGNVTRYQYDAANQLVAIVDGNGNRTSYEYDELGRQISVTDGEGNITRTEYDKVGNVVATVDGNKNRTEYEFDNRDRQITVTDAEDGTTITEYDDVGNVVLVSDQLTRPTKYTYDSRNRQTSITDPLTHTTKYEYDDLSNVTKITDANNHSTTFTFDGLNRQIDTTNELKDSKTNTYDALGNLIATTDELGRTTTYTYDLQNRQIAVTDPNGNITKTEYDERGNIIATIDADDNRTETQYDQLNRQIATVDANQQLTKYEYDAVGNLVSITDPEKNVTRYTYDKANRRISDTNQLGDSRSYEYDPAGNIIKTTDRNGRIKTYSFDKLNRSTTEEWLDENNNPIRTFNYNYDKASQLISVNDSDSAYAYVYDLNGRLIEVDNAGTPSVPNVVFNYDYDPVGNLLSVTDTIDGEVKGTEAFTHDELNRVTRITQSGNDVADKRVDISYDKASQMTGMSRYSNLAGTNLVAESNYTYDKFGRLTDLTHESQTDVLANYNWVYDETNRLTQYNSPEGTANYSYDDLDQITAADYDYQSDENYSYDDNGNRVGDGYVTGENNQLLSDGIYNYEYDAEGNRVRRIEIATGIVTEYEWDYRNRLTSVVTKDSSGNVVANSGYTYDAFNKRIAKSVDADGDGAGQAVVERYVLDGDHIALTFDGEGNLTERFLHGTEIDQIIAQENSNGEVLWALTDHQGSVKMLLDNDGSVVNNITYDAFGGITIESNPNVNFRFGYTGREHDEETGLDYYGARYRDPSLGRFISEDTIGFAGGDLNLYRYTFNSPLNYTDPDGNTPLVLVPAAVGAAVVVAGAISYLVYDTIQKFVEDSPGTQTFPRNPTAENTDEDKDRKRVPAPKPDPKPIPFPFPFPEPPNPDPNEEECDECKYTIDENHLFYPDTITVPGQISGFHSTARTIEDIDYFWVDPPSFDADFEPFNAEFGIPEKPEFGSKFSTFFPMNLTDTGVLELIGEAYIKDGCKPSGFWSAAVINPLTGEGMGIQGTVQNHHILTAFPS
ncbi:MAG: FG-GAP-like repeat-containing protein [Cyanobacteria bacterium P01_A01_bin.40]